MKFLLSGEGPTDIGLRSYGGTFEHGPMTLFIDMLAEPILGYSARQIETEPGDILEFCSRQELMDRGKPKGVKFAGKKYGKGRAYPLLQRTYHRLVVWPCRAGGLPRIQGVRQCNDSENYHSYRV